MTETRLDEGVPRILHIVPRMVRRGAEVFAAQLAEALGPASRNLLFPLWGPPEDEPAAPVRVVAGARPQARLERALGIDPGARIRLRDGLLGLRPDLVVAHGGEPLKYAALADPRGRIPLAYRKISHAASTRRERAMGWVLHRPVLVLAVTDELRDELVERFGVDPAVIRVIPTSRKPPPSLDDGERAAVRRSIGADPDRPLLAWAGRLSTEKQPWAAVQAFALVRSRFGPAALALCGDGPLRPAVERAAGAIDGALVLGSRPDADRIIAAADLVLSTSATEGAPGVLVEAALAGVPAIAFDVGEVGRVVVDGETGLLVPAGDLEAMADMAVELLGDPTRHRRMADEARRHAAPFRLDAVVGRYATAFADVLGPKGDALRRAAAPGGPLSAGPAGPVS